MSGPLRYCGRADCRLCHPQPVEHHDELGRDLVTGALAIIVLLITVFVLWPVL